MVQLKSFKIIEPPAAAGESASESAATAAAAAGAAVVATVEQQPVGSQEVSGESASAGQQRPVEFATGQKGWQFPSSAAESQPSGNSSTETTVAPSSGADSPQPATVLRRTTGGGGNLTSSETGSSSSSSSTTSGRSVSSSGERKRRRRPTAAAASADKVQAQQQLAEVVGVSAVATSVSGTRDSSSELTTLSSNEEYQLARVEMGDDEDEHQEQQVPTPAPVTNKENVTRIDIGCHRAASASAAATPPATPANLTRSSNSAQPKHALKLNLQQMARPHTSPSQLNQNTVPAPALQPGGTPQLASKIERGRLTGPPPLSPPLSPALRSIAARQQPDNMSQHSFAQAKYAGSKHFEIRWQNVRLFAQPKSLLPSFISENPIYTSLFGRGESTLTSQQNTLLAFEPLKPPYSPPLNHHKIPPTIDEHLEMKCPNSPGGGVAETQVGAPAPAAGISTTHGVGDSTGGGGYSTLGKLAQGVASTNAPPTNNVNGVRCVLNNISGQVFSGQMTAVLGPSGVGKTSLLNSLTGRNTLDGTGRVSLIGAQESKRMSVVTVPQNDVLPGKLTCLEDLQFTSRLKNPQARFDHRRNIDRLVKHLHMEKFLKTRIDKLSGGEARRLSIARELLSSPDIMILDEPTSGLDANTCKKIIAALRDIVEHSDNILDKPMSIIITIHQPQQEVYHLFHRVYVMAQGGRVVYEGSPHMLLPTLLEQSSLTRVCPPDQLNENPAIVAIEVASGEFGESVIEELAIYHESKVYEEFSTFGVGPNALGNFESPMMTPRSLGARTPHNKLHRKRLNSFDSSLGRPTPQLGRRGPGGVAANNGLTTDNIPLGSPKMDRMSSMTSLSFASTYDEYLPEVTSRLKVDKRLRRSVVIKSHFVSHTLTLISRCWLLTRRDMFLMAIRILGFLMVASGTVQIFSNALNPDEHQCPQFESEIDDMATYIGSVRVRLTGLLDTLRQANSVHLFFFHLLLCITMVTSALTGLVFPLQMRMFVREYKNGWYSPASFIMSQTIAELPADIIGPLLALVIAYPLCHQPDSMYHWRLIGYCLVFIVTSIICKSQAQIVGAFLMDSVENSVFISCVCVTAPALLSGIPLRVRSMPTPLQWVSYGSFLRYSFESLMELRYGYGMCPCDSELVDGPLHASSRAIPAHLENLATGLLELTVPNSTTPNELTGGGGGAQIGQAEHENLFLKFLRLTSDASNLFQDSKEIEHCSSYRSLYLISMGIDPGSLVFWATVMVSVFVLSRFLTYFAVKTVIKLRRS